MADILKKKLIPFVIIFVIVLSSLSFVSFAEDNNLVSDNFNSWSSESYSANVNFTYSNGVNRVQFNNPTSDTYLAYYTIPALIYSHSFNLQFKVRGNFVRMNLSVFLQNGSDSSQRYLINSYSSNITSDSSFSVSFVPTDIFSNISSLRLYFEFDCQGNYNSFSVYVSDIYLLDLSGSFGGNYNNAFNSYIAPANIFFIEQVNTFLNLIESEWYYLFAWYVLNTGFIVTIIGVSIFDWIDIFHEGMLNFGIRKHYDIKKQNFYDKQHELRVRDSEARYQAKREQLVSDWEVRNYMSKSKGFMTFEEAKLKVIEIKNRKNQNKEKNNSKSDDK